MPFRPVDDLDVFGAEARFHHVGIAVKEISEVLPTSDPVHDPIQRVSVAFVRMNGVPVELVEPEGPQSPVQKSLAKGAKLLHICYEVPDLDDALEACSRHGFRRLSSPAPAAAFDGRQIVWVYSGDYGLFELLEGAAKEGDGGTDVG